MSDQAARLGVPAGSIAEALRHPALAVLTRVQRQDFVAAAELGRKASAVQHESRPTSTEKTPHRGPSLAEPASRSGQNRPVEAATARLLGWTTRGGPRTKTSPPMRPRPPPQEAAPLPVCGASFSHKRHGCYSLQWTGQRQEESSGNAPAAQAQQIPLQHHASRAPGSGAGPLSSTPSKAYSGSSWTAPMLLRARRVFSPSPQALATHRRRACSSACAIARFGQRPARRDLTSPDSPTGIAAIGGQP